MYASPLSEKRLQQVIDEKNKDQILDLIARLEITKKEIEDQLKILSDEIEKLNDDTVPDLWEIPRDYALRLLEDGNELIWNYDTIVTNPGVEYRDCDAQECWYHGNLDRVGELKKLYHVRDEESRDILLTMCDVCFGNFDHIMQYNNSSGGINTFKSMYVDLTKAKDDITRKEVQAIGIADIEGDRKIEKELCPGDTCLADNVWRDSVPSVDEYIAGYRTFWIKSCKHKNPPIRVAWVAPHVINEKEQGDAFSRWELLCQCKLCYPSATVIKYEDILKYNSAKSIYVAHHSKFTCDDSDDENDEIFMQDISDGPPPTKKRKL